jgi:hypothetical protein
MADALIFMFLIGFCTGFVACFILTRWIVWNVVNVAKAAKETDDDDDNDPYWWKKGKPKPY